MASQFVSILSALSIQTVRVTKPASRRNAEIPVSARAVLILSVRLLIINQSVLAQLDLRATRECSAQFQPLKVIFISAEYTHA
jgi:hypothetical protein